METTAVKGLAFDTKDMKTMAFFAPFDQGARGVVDSRPRQIDSGRLDLGLEDRSTVATRRLIAAAARQTILEVNLQIPAEQCFPQLERPARIA
jgi:hypothetical protein